MSAAVVARNATTQGLATRIRRPSPQLVAPLVLGLIAVATHLIWFEPGAVLSGGDWQHYSLAEARGLYFSSGSWSGTNGLGRPNIQVSFNIFFWVWSAMTNIGFTWDQAVAVTFLIPIAFLNFLAPYFLIRKLTARVATSFACALFYGTTTYGIVNQVPIQFVYALAPLVLLLFIRALETKLVSHWVVFGIVFSVAACYEIRITYILAFVLASYALVMHASEARRLWRGLLAAAVVVLGLNAFWLLPTVLGSAPTAVRAVAQRGLFGTGLYDLRSALALHLWNWTGGLQNSLFQEQPIPLYFWFVPLVVALGSLWARGLAARDFRKHTFFASTTLVGLLLAKEAAPPFGVVYGWLYAHFPGFALYRESSKFYLVVALGYTVLLGYALSRARLPRLRAQDRTLRAVLVVVVGGLSLWNTKPLVTGDLGYLLVGRQQPADYGAFAQFVDRQDEYFRTLWLPRESQWATTSYLHPRVSVESVLPAQWVRALARPHDLSGVAPATLFAAAAPWAGTVHHLVDDASVKYVVVPLQDIANDDDFFGYYGQVRAAYIAQLNSVRWLHKVDIGASALAVFENTKFLPHVSVDTHAPADGGLGVEAKAPLGGSIRHVDFSISNPTHIRVRLQGLAGRVLLRFSEGYDSQWALLLRRPSTGVDGCTAAGGRDTGAAAPTVVAQCDSAAQFGEPIGLLPGSAAHVLATPHRTLDGYENGWVIDSLTVATEHPSLVTRNVDGSVDLDLDLYFRPQNYYYIGLMVSGTAVLGVIAFLALPPILRRKRQRGAVT